MNDDVYCGDSCTGIDCSTEWDSTLHAVVYRCRKMRESDVMVLHSGGTFSTEVELRGDR